MPEVRLLVPAEWRVLRQVRLRALRDSPHAFLSTYQQEGDYAEPRWRCEFQRGRWTVGAVAGRAVGLLGVTRGYDVAADDRYLEYLWIAPGHRRSGLGLTLLTTVVGQLRTVGIRTVYLWVLDGNELALRLYRRVGFVSTGVRQPLAGRPGVSEERFALDLAGRPG
jgi:ribosomal protein S18 acetylase RimI-like enzyme